MDSPSSPPLSVILCVHGTAYDRFRHVLRHLLVGLVDQAVHLRLLSADARIEALTLGPVQSLIHERIGWPWTKRRIGQVLEALSSQPPMIVHALSHESYRLGGVIAESFDADLILSVTSLKDCDAMMDLRGGRAGRFLAASQPLVSVLTEQVKIQEQRVDLVRPGVLSADRIACFAQPEHLPAILCLSPFEQGSGVDHLIEAADLLRKRDHAFMLFLLGTGPKESSYRRIIRERNLSSHVTIVQPAGDMTEVMHKADILVRLLTDTAFTADSLQAMGAGMAVVTLPNLICDYQRHEETALVCNKPTAKSLAGAMERLLHDPVDARRIAAAGMEHIHNHHTVSNMAERTADAYRKLTLARATFSIKK